MRARIEDQIIYNKNAKLKAFLTKFADVMLVALFFISFITVSFLISDSKKTEDRFLAVFAMVGIAVVASIIVGLWSALKTKNVCVKISKGMVDVTINKAHGVYPLEDYIGIELSNAATSRFSVRKEIVFANKEDPDKNLYIELPVKPELFVKIADSIMITKHETYGGGEQYKAYEGDEYKSTYEPVFSGKLIGIVVVAMIIEIAMAAVFVSMGFEKINHLLYVMIIAVIFIATVSFLIYSINYKKKSQKMSVTSIKFDTAALKINDQVFAYKDIENICMTPPYVHHFSAYYRELTIKLYDSKKPIVFFVGNRPDDENQKEISEGCSCTYPELYARIINDRNLENKFSFKNFS